MIRAEQISLQIGDFRLRSVTLEVPCGEYFVLLGPPGSGKTVFLETICGLKRIDSGRIHIDGRDVTDVEPRHRGLGYVPQDYALFPHLTVERNISFGLRPRERSGRVVTETVGRTAERLRISHLLNRRTAGLSGGERQRVALARALAMNPKVLLLDEPVNTLDESTRESVCAELRRLHRESGVTTIHVSHHLEEAFSVADRAGVLNKGRFEQLGPMADLLRKPASEFVARFMRSENIFRGQPVGLGDELGTTTVQVGATFFTVPGTWVGPVTFIIRPEQIHLTRSGDAFSYAARLNLRLARIVDRGAYFRVELNGPHCLVAHLSYAAFHELAAPVGSELTAVVRQDSIHVLPEF